MLHINIIFRDIFLRFIVVLPLLVIPTPASWKTELVDCDADERLNSVIIHSSGNMIAIGDEMTVVFSEDSGKSWDESKMPDIKGWAGEDEYILSSIKEIPESGELLMTLVENDVEQTHMSRPDFERRTAIFSSLDGGKSWTVLSKIANAALYWIFVFSDGQCILTGASNHIYEYKNGIIEKIGKNPLANEEMITTMHIQFFGKIRFDGSVNIKQHGDILYMKNENSYSLSRNKGRSWEVLKKFHTDKSINAISLFDSNSVVAGCDNGTILLLDNQYDRKIAGEIANRDINDISVSSQCNWWVSGDEGLLAFSPDRGKTWSVIKNNYEEDLYSIMMDPSCNEIWVCGDKGGLVRVYDDKFVSSITDDSESENTDDTLSKILNNQKNFCLLNESDTLVQGVLFSVTPGNCTITTGRYTYSGDTFRIQLPIGEHVFQISRDGYFPITENINIKRGEVEEENISLRKVGAVIAPSAGLLFTSADYGVNFSLLTGVLSSNNNAAGLEINADIVINNPFNFLSFSAFYGYNFHLSDNLSLFPSISIGGSIVQETEQADSYNSYDTITHTNKGALFINSSSDFVFKKSNRWGYVVRPSIAWIGNWGMLFYIRFGGIVWI